MNAGAGERADSPAGHHRRRAGRRRAIEVLYEADVMGRRPSDVLEEWRSLGRPVSQFTTELVAGVESTRDEIDAVLEANSDEWPVTRMPAVDRTVLRVALYELRTGTPAGVAISEAVEAANELSTEDSGRFVNGILGRIAREAE